MLGISFWRVTKAAAQNFWRNVWLSVATTVIMTITLLLMSFLYFANVFGANVLDNIEQKVDLLVTFKENVQDEYISAVGKEFEVREDVSSVRIVTSDEALEILQSNHEGDTVLEDSLHELGENPLPASMYIAATEPRFYENIARQLETEKYAPFVEQVHFEDSAPVFEQLETFLTNVRNISFVITVVFASLVVLIMFNTVRLAIYSFREEIDIMRLVGASRWFVQGPFVMEGILVALIATGLANVIVFPVLRSASPFLQGYFADTQSSPLNLYQHALANWEIILGLQLLVGVGLAVFSSYVAVRRYLRD